MHGLRRIQQMNREAEQPTLTERTTLPAGLIVRVGGVPFRLVNDTEVEGHHALKDLEK